MYLLPNHLLHSRIAQKMLPCRFNRNQFADHIASGLLGCSLHDGQNWSDLTGLQFIYGGKDFRV